MGRGRLPSKGWGINPQISLITQMTQFQISCLNCGLPYPETGVPYCCPSCGGLFDFARLWTFDPSRVDATQLGFFRFARTFGLPAVSDTLSLGEGNTPLVWAEAFGRKVAFKCEFQNPTGSFKDRGTAALVAFLKSRGVTDAVEDSSGNAGASFAAYAARAGIQARVFIPESASGPKRRQIEAYGAELVPVAGARANAAEAVKKAADAGTVYASHAYLPFNLPSYATIAYEIVEQLGSIPAAVIVPVGQGGLLLGSWRGFGALKQAGVTREAPKMIGVQAEACSPFVKDEGGRLVLSEVEGMKDERYTIAEGVRVAHPLRWEAVRQAVKESGGSWIAIVEEEILRGRDALAIRGFYVEPTSAIIWKVLEEILPKLPDPVVVVLTGAGLKYSGL